ncbi:ATP-binding protein [Methylorubrum sp. DB1722]|uniref:ATP-binding protein n=1 Tax=Methylorubrum sp. DB1722 TaxID=2478916 RepID=UPI0018E2C0CE|nr:ATP-binding protein [Methylorubrum sp. DB1722]MBI1689672.1 AAA family ATPase [Methylorubrum sp. DB1722]
MLFVDKIDANPRIDSSTVSRLSLFKTVYVTGAPASGKSSTVAKLKERVPDLNVWEYGARLTEFLRSRGTELKDQDELRSQSARIVTPSDIDALDGKLLEWVAETRSRGPVVIDSHPVTKEDYGFRVTAFSGDGFRRLGPDEIWLFYVAPEVTCRRISKDAAGRPTITLEEARIHSAAQASVACTFGIAAGCPVYMFDTDVDQADLVDQLAARLGR